jgi:hypothetical protein
MERHGRLFPVPLRCFADPRAGANQAGAGVVALPFRPAGAGRAALPFPRPLAGLRAAGMGTEGAVRSAAVTVSSAPAGLLPSKAAT